VRLFVVCSLIWLLGASPRDMDRRPPSGLVSGLTFNRASAYDNRGNTWTNIASPAFSSGVVNLNGSTQYIVADNSSAGSASGDFTVGLWINVNSIPISAAFIPVSKYLVAPDGDQGYALLVRNNASLRVVFRAGTGSQQDIDTTAASISAATWTHVVVTRSGTTLKIHINGAESASATVSGNSISNSMPVHIGAFKSTLAGSVTSFFPGKIDDVRIYDLALTATEIAQLFQMTRNETRP